jgi:hypothetical protein
MASVNEELKKLEGGFQRMRPPTTEEQKCAVQGYVRSQRVTDVEGLGPRSPEQLRSYPGMMTGEVLKGKIDGREVQIIINNRENHVHFSGAAA